MKRLIQLLFATIGVALCLCQVAAATPYYAGRVVTTLTILITTPLPGTDDVGCSTSVIVSDGANGEYSELVYGKASLFSSSPLQYQCTLTIPWEWQLANPTTDTLTINVSTGFVPSGSTSIQGLTRSSSHTLFVPAANLGQNPTIITENLNARL